MYYKNNFCYGMYYYNYYALVYTHIVCVQVCTCVHGIQLYVYT